jgi:hypothetical protein
MVAPFTSLARAALLLAALVAWPANAQAPVAGYVLTVQGNWKLQDAKTPVLVGMEVPAGASFLASNASTSDNLVVVERKTGKVLVAVRCDPVRSCAEPVRVAEGAGASDSGSPTSELLDRLFARLRGRPDRYVASMSRGMGSGPPWVGEAVLELQNGNIAVAPALRQAPAGKLLLRFTPAGCKGCDPADHEYLWDPASPAPLAGAQIPPGLYELVARRSPSATPDRGNTGWVRVVDASQYARASAAFRQGRSISDSWGNGVDENTRTRFHRALLASLGEE